MNNNNISKYKLPRHSAVIVLRLLAVSYLKNSKGKSLKESAFEYENIETFIKGKKNIFRIDIAEGFRDLCNNDFIVVVEKNENMSNTKFTLTEEGYQLGLSEEGILNILKTTTKTIWNTGSIIGIAGTPFALGSLFSGLINWSSPIEFMISIWQKKVSTPIQNLISLPLLYFELPKIPLWLSDYFAVGLIIAASTLISNEAEESLNESGIWLRPKADSGIKKIFAFIGVSFIWPYFIISRGFFYIWMFMLYSLDRRKIPTSLQIIHTYEMVVVGGISYSLPILTFLPFFLFDFFL